jgi:hypothetical protein
MDYEQRLEVTKERIPIIDFPLLRDLAYASNYHLLSPNEELNDRFLYELIYLDIGKRYGFTRYFEYESPEVHPSSIDKCDICVDFSCGDKSLIMDFSPYDGDYFKHTISVKIKYADYSNKLFDSLIDIVFNYDTKKYEIQYTDEAGYCTYITLYFNFYNLSIRKMRVVRHDVKYDIKINLADKERQVKFDPTNFLNSLHSIADSYIKIQENTRIENYVTNKKHSTEFINKPRFIYNGYAYSDYSEIVSNFIVLAHGISE